ncbi:zinc finger protein 37 homolog isoform X2 [Perca flavescens]|uniref:zinc finger protein 37 homolog isoform X2 n=1 Tax=Perca flavescens TaxID=8167 RepID=UPI00106E2910|nr:zinc finger protein 37 homolog isoform X2 [Perca flavescens]
MSSVEHLRQFVNERLTAAAEEIFGVLINTIVKYEEEITRQRRRLDVVWKPEIKLHRIKELPQQHVCKEEEEEEEGAIQERSSSLDQEEPKPPQIKQEQEGLCTSQEGEQLTLKQETDVLMLTPTHSEDQTLNWDPDDPLGAAEEESAVNMPVIASVVSEAHSDPQLRSHNSQEAESKNQGGGEHGESGSTRKAEPKPNRRRHKSNSHTNNVNNPNLLKIHRNTDTELPQQHDCKEEEEEEGAIQERSSSLDQEEPKPPQIKQEQEGLCTSQEGEQLTLKQETDVLMLTPTHSEDQTLNWDPDDPLGAAEEESAVNMPVIASVVSEAHSDPQLRSHNSQEAEKITTPKGGEKRRRDKSNSQTMNVNNPNLLKTHRNTDTGKTSFNCDTCGKGFKYNSLLQRHAMIHTDEKPYSCQTCGKDFRHHSHLLAHVKTHTGEKLYSCKTCGRAFICSSVLKNPHENPHRREAVFLQNVWETFQK